MMGEWITLTLSDHAEARVFLWTYPGMPDAEKTSLARRKLLTALAREPEEAIR